MNEPHNDLSAASESAGLTNIERVRLALAMADAGYEWGIELEYVEALLKAYDDLRDDAQPAAKPIAWMNREHIGAYMAGAPRGLAWASPEQTEFYDIALFASQPSPAATVEHQEDVYAAQAKEYDAAQFPSADSRRDEIVAGAFYKTRGDKNNLPHIVGPLEHDDDGDAPWKARVYDQTWKWSYDGLVNADGAPHNRDLVERVYRPAPAEPQRLPEPLVNTLMFQIYTVLGDIDQRKKMELRKRFLQDVTVALSRPHLARGE